MDAKGGDDDIDGLTSNRLARLARLTKWIWKLIPKTRGCTAKWAMCDFQSACVPDVFSTTNGRLKSKESRSEPRIKFRLAMH